MDYASGDSWMSHDVSQDRKNLSFQSLGDKLPVSVTISSLETGVQDGDECYSVGEYHFRTVQTVGMVLEVTKEDGRTVYLLHDPDNTESTFSVVIFGSYEEGGSRFVEGDLQEDARVKVMGKLKNVAGEKKLLAYYFKRLCDEKDYEIFKLEAEASRLFFEKNLIEKMRRGQTDDWDGMLAPPRRNEATFLSPTTFKPVKTEQTSSKTGGHHQLIPKIRAIIRNELHLGHVNGHQGGIPILQILKRSANVTLARLREVLQVMEEENMIYQVTTDEFLPFD